MRLEVRCLGAPGSGSEIKFEHSPPPMGGGGRGGGWVIGIIPISKFSIDVGGTPPTSK